MIIDFSIEHIGREVKSHAHDYGQFVMPYSGSMHIEFENQSYVIDEKSIAYIPPNVMHKYSSDLLIKTLVVNVSHKLIKEYEHKILLSNCRYILNDRIKIIVDFLKEEVEHEAGIDALKYLFFYIYDKIVEMRTYKSILYIHENYQQEIKINTLADLECYSAAYYTDWFKSSIGMSPTRYIKRVRIAKAKELLLTTKYNLTQIAYHVGYNHSSTMCKVFKELEDMTPKEYRKTYL